MKLSQLPKGAKIYNEHISDGSSFIIFDHVDGMYSFCRTEKGNTIPLPASIELVDKNDGYEIAPHTPSKESPLTK